MIDDMVSFPSVPPAQPAVITGAAVKVMRSYDYCHFEVALSTEFPVTTEDVDELRKAAMRLADQAVEQYKIARKVEEGKLSARRQLGVRWLEEEVQQIVNDIPEDERTPEQKARVKLWEDFQFQAQFEYDYEDDFDYEEDFERPER
jgi:uncharacterized protein YicC (UPF0701 family)